MTAAAVHEPSFQDLQSEIASQVSNNNFEKESEVNEDFGQTCDLCGGDHETPNVFSVLSDSPNDPETEKSFTSETFIETFMEEMRGIIDNAKVCVLHQIIDGQSNEPLTVTFSPEQAQIIRAALARFEMESAGDLSPENYPGNLSDAFDENGKPTDGLLLSGIAYAFVKDAVFSDAEDLIGPITAVANRVSGDNN